jgi:hypothetical protein
MTLNSTLSAKESGEIGGIVNIDRPIGTNETITTSTVEDDGAPPSSADDKARGDESTKESGEKTLETAPEESTEETRYDKIPRFQQLRKEAEDAKAAAEAEKVARIRLEAQMEIVNRPIEPPPPVKAEPTFKDTSKMDTDDLAQWQANDPIGYERNLRESIKFELLKDLNQHAEKNAAQTAREKDYLVFGQANPDFEARWVDKSIPEFLATHPGHNAMSAYHELKRADREAEVEARIAKVKEDTEREVIERIKAKQTPTGLGDGPAAAPIPRKGDAGADPNNQHGGKSAMLRVLQQLRGGA